jgi:hypothetical protein
MIFLAGEVRAAVATPNFLKARSTPRDHQSVRHNKRLQFRRCDRELLRLQPTTRQLTYQSTRSPSVQSSKMGRLHSNGKGISASAIPYSRNPPAWLKTTPEQVVEQIQKLAKKGATPSQIGEILRDSHGIAQTKGKFCDSACYACANCAQSSPETRSSESSSPTVWLPAQAEALVDRSSALVHLPRYTNLPLLVQS